jgi:hypothetical protein
VADLGFDPLNPPQLSREDRQVVGCDCGGLQWHSWQCSIWSMDREQALQAIADAEGRARAHADMLNAKLRVWEASR